jgi:hypothetical protein
MTGEPGEILERDGRFPSGPWTGFFLQPATVRRRMQLHLTFRQGALRGDGYDWIGSFTVNGHYDVKDGRCWWTKHYIGRQTVSYSGYNEGKGIWVCGRSRLHPEAGSTSGRPGWTTRRKPAVR